jgi:PilZ domain
MFDRRKEPRVSVRTRGVINFGATGTELPCTVNDLTPRGAGLSVGTTFGLPQIFRLTIDGETRSRHCRVVWMDGKRLGVLFE